MPDNSDVAASLDAERTDLSYQRTLMSHERTLMAWVRTSLAMTTFGFSLFSFFQYVTDEDGAASAMFLGPRNFALILIALSTLMLGAASDRDAAGESRGSAPRTPHPASPCSGR